MKQQFEVVAATRVAATQLAPHLRQVDVQEIAASSGEKPLDALISSIEVSDPDMVWALQWNRLPVGLFGVSRLSEEIGGAWLLASAGIYQNKPDFWLKSRTMLDIMHTRYKFLTNFIDERNAVTQRWLEVLGWRPVQRIEHFGAGKLPFIQYVSQRI